jgi:hypothetical protein
VEAKVGRSSASPVVKAATTAAAATAAADDADDIKMNNAIMRALLHLRHLNGENLADKTGKTQLQKHDALSSKTPTLMTEGKISS